ncbi:4Fe-4S binding protein [Methanohalobium sp.]|uniref:4Fe-4S binding protein n=1 Tax=Methanohalobium sp. TaxID=2837493 RepID=UPI0025EA7814|nr:4Fe-4S binding protein [Methanohalobium sp.]
MSKKINFERLKLGGILPQRQNGDLYSIRLRIVGGQLNSNQLRALADATEKYGSGEIHITSRQGVEISYVPIDYADKMLDELENSGVHQGACGPRVRGIVSCQGNRVCPRGLIDAEYIAGKIDEKYFAKNLPSKFKFAVTGCPASCMKPQENDFGIMGSIEPKWVGENCTFCGLCESTCPTDAIKIEDNTIHIDRDKCNLCGDCISICPTEAWIKANSGYTIYVGGKVGRFPKLAIKLIEMVEEDELFKIIDKTFNFYKENAQPDERFRNTIDRVGFDNYKQSVLTQDHD